jgi:hypothetical protein
MSATIESIELSAMTLVALLAESEASAKSQIDAYLASIGTPDAPHYFTRLAVKKGNERRVGHIEYAVIPDGTKAPKPLSTYPVPASHAMKLLIPASLLEDYEDKGFKDDIDAFLKARNARMEFFPLVLMRYETPNDISVIIPYKKR